MGKISGCRHLKVNLKAKIYIYVNSTTQPVDSCITKFYNRFIKKGLPFLEPFFACLASKFEKSTNKTFKIFLTNQERYQKAQNFTLISNPLKKFFKSIQKKLLAKT
jgi:hypothetical protein